VLAHGVSKVRYVVRTPGFHHEAGPELSGSEAKQASSHVISARIGPRVEYSDVVCSKDDCRRAFRRGC
jgi:hypothetical protein